MFRSPSAIMPASFSQTGQQQNQLRSSGSSRATSLGARLAVNQLTTRPWNFYQDVIGYERAGLSAIGLAVDKIDQFGRDEAITLFRQSPLQASSLNWIAGFTGANGYTLKDALTEGIDTLNLADALQAPTVVVVTGPRNGHTWNHADEIITDSLQKLGEHAQQLGIQLALMPMSKRYQANWSYLPSMSHALQLVKTLDHANVGLALHTSHVYREPGLPLVLEKAAPWTRLVRLADCSGSPQSDNDQRWLGQGNVPVNAIAAAIERAGYEGFFEVDVWSQELWQVGDFRPFLESITDLAFGSAPPAAPILH